MQDIDLQIERIIEDSRNRRFAWGRFDCAIFAANAMKMLHGVDIKLPVYANQRDALRALKQLGGWESALRQAGFVEKQSADRGDVVITDGYNWPCLGVALGIHAASPATIGVRYSHCKDWASVWGLKCLN